MSGKYTKLINNDLLESSNDNFRSSLGGFYQDVETSKGDELLLSSGTDISPANEDIEKVFFDLDNQVVADYSNLTPSYTFPVRIASNSTSFLDYDDWRTFVVGGVYADKSYEPKVTSTDHEYRNFSYELPYTKMESLGLETEPISQVIQISKQKGVPPIEIAEKIGTFGTSMHSHSWCIWRCFIIKVIPETKQIVTTQLSGSLSGHC